MTGTGFAYWITVIVLSGVLVAFVLLVIQLAWVVWLDRADARAARRRARRYRAEAPARAAGGRLR